MLCCLIYRHFGVSFSRVIYLKTILVLQAEFVGGTEERHERFQSGWSVLRPGFEQTSYEIQSFRKSLRLIARSRLSRQTCFTQRLTGTQTRTYLTSKCRTCRAASRLSTYHQIQDLNILFTCGDPENLLQSLCTRWFKYDRDDLCVNKSQFVPVIFEPPCIYPFHTQHVVSLSHFSLVW